jgi:two-component system, OmpR family, response regulator
MRVLLVEDDADSAEALSLLLEYAGIEVATAGTGAAALGALERVRRRETEAPDAIIVDLMLPDMSGATLIERMSFGGALPPVVLHSAAPEHVLREAADRMRAAAILRKPTACDQVVETLQSIVLRAVAGTRSRSEQRQLDPERRARIPEVRADASAVLFHDPLRDV